MLVVLFAWPRKAWLGAAFVTGAVLAGILALRLHLLPAALAERLIGFSEVVQTFDVRGVDITPENYAVVERLAHWQSAQEMARYHLWLGIGFGNYEPVYPGYALINWPYPLGHAHNIYLNLLAETGIVGLSAYLTLWAVIFWQTWQVTRSTSSWPRAAAVGLMGTWAHLSVHQLLDKLYVANLHLHIGALLGILTIFIALGQEHSDSSDRFNRDDPSADRCHPQREQGGAGTRSGRAPRQRNGPLHEVPGGGDDWRGHRLRDIYRPQHPAAV
jgi:O-antigen ligase